MDISFVLHLYINSPNVAYIQFYPLFFPLCILDKFILSSVARLSLRKKKRPSKNMAQRTFPTGP